MISHKHKFIFIHIPRTGGTTIEHMLVNYQEGKLIEKGGGIWIPDESTQLKILKVFPDFNFENDSKHMTASQWKLVLGDDYQDYYKFTIVRNPFDKCLSIKKFLSKRPDIRGMKEWLIKQHIFIEDNDGNTIIDDIFFHETIEDAWKNICEKLDIKEEPLIHKNNKKSLNLKLSKDEIEWIKINLKNDFNKFKYKL